MSKEPGRRERADAWATAIGLQKVDGLSPSRFLIETAKEHIEGRITQGQARRRIHDYYAAKDEANKPDPELDCDEQHVQGEFLVFPQRTLKVPRPT